MGRRIDKLHCRSFVSDVVGYPQYFSATSGDVSTTRPIAVLAHRSQCLDFFISTRLLLSTQTFRCLFAFLV